MKLQSFARRVSAFASIGAVAVLSSCSKGGSDSGTAIPDPDKVADKLNQEKTVIETSLENEMAAAFPVGLNLSSVTAVESSESSNLTSNELVNLVDTPEGVIEEETTESSIAEKANEAKEVLDAKSAEMCRPKLRVKNLRAPDCYAKQLLTADAAATTGQDMAGQSSENIFFPTDLAPIQGAGAEAKRGIRFGDAGVIHAKEGDNACLAATSTYYVESTSEVVDRATDLVAKALCAAKAEKQDALPAAGKSVNLAPLVNKVWGLKAIQVQKAVVTRIDKGDGEAIFRTVLRVVYKAPRPRLAPGQGADGAEDMPEIAGAGKKRPRPLPRAAEFENRTMTVELINKPAKKDGDKNYAGRLVVIENGRSVKENGSDKKQAFGISVRYKREGDVLRMKFGSANFNVGFGKSFWPAVFLNGKTGAFDFKKIMRDSDVTPPKLETRKMNLAGDSASHFVAEAEFSEESLFAVPPPPVAQGPGPVGGPGAGGKKRVVDNIVAGGFEVNLAEQTGKMAYHWQASLGDKAARSFIVNVSKDSATGKLGGCGIAGYSGAFGSDDEGKIKGFYCGWAQKNNSQAALDATLHPAVQQQCFTKSDDGKAWVLDDAKNSIKFAVAEDCGQTSNSAAYNLEPVVASAGKVTQKATEPQVEAAEVELAAPVEQEALKE